MMKRSTTGQLRDPNITLRTRNTLRVSIVLFVAFLVLSSLFAYLTQSTHNGNLYVVAGTALICSVISILAARHSRRGQIETAAYFMIAAIILFCPVATLVLSGVGLTLGISSLVAIFMIATLTLVPPQLNIINAVGVLFGIAIILLDTFFPSDRIDIQLVKILLPVVTTTSIIAFGFQIFEQFLNYPLRTKLIIFFIMVAVLSVSAVAFITNGLARNAVEQQVGQLQQGLAARLAFETGKELQNNVEILQATGTQFEEFAAGTNELYAGEDDEILQRILDLDNRWRTADEQSLLIRNVINHEIADELREFQAHFPDHVELFITDKYGANIAATNRTTDYYQADEDWWKAAYNQEAV